MKKGKVDLCSSGVNVGKSLLRPTSGREIKFRFWGKHNEKFIYCDLFNVNKGVLYWSDLNEEYHIPQQYTGLKDKNGQEIYEGDYIHRADGYVGLVEYGRVLHSNTGLAYIGFYLRKNKDNYTYIDGTLEVIGNIFEGDEK